MAKDKEKERKKLEETKINTGTVKASEEVLHFVIETRAQFYPTFHKSRATRQETAIFRVPNQKEHGNCKQVVRYVRSAQIFRRNCFSLERNKFFPVSLSFVAHLR